MVLEDGEAGGWCPQSFGDHCGKLCWQLVAMDGRGSLDYNIKTELDSGPAQDRQTEFNSIEGIISIQAISKFNQPCIRAFCLFNNCNKKYFYIKYS